MRRGDYVHTKEVIKNQREMVSLRFELDFAYVNTLVLSVKKMR